MDVRHTGLSNLVFKKDPPLSRHGCIRWHPPRTGWVKINVELDGAVSHNGVAGMWWHCTR